MRVARRYLIEGRVQGVGFRAFAEHQAAIEGLHGWARNLPDGRVEVVWEGEQSAVDRAEAKLRRGPAHADVRAVSVEDAPPGGRATGFTIRG
jgi:acylphosphatase